MMERAWTVASEGEGGAWFMSLEAAMNLDVHDLDVMEGRSLVWILDDGRGGGSGGSMVLPQLGAVYL